jgi:hypothetical protein
VQALRRPSELDLLRVKTLFSIAICWICSSKKLGLAVSVLFDEKKKKKKKTKKKKDKKERVESSVRAGCQEPVQRNAKDQRTVANRAPPKGT